MQVTEPKSARADVSPPRWVSWTLLVGSAILLWWSWFLLGFLPEPSAVGRTRAILAVLAGSGIGTAVLGVAAAIALLRNARWAWRLGIVAAALMILSIVGAIVGIPAVFGLAAGRRSAKP